MYIQLIVQMLQLRYYITFKSNIWIVLKYLKFSSYWTARLNHCKPGQEFLFCFCNCTGVYRVYIYTEWGVQYWTLRYAPANWLQIEPKRRRALTKDFPSKIQAQIPGYCCFYIFLMENYSSLFQANGIPRVLENRKKICFFVYCNI